jgi:hypothetical protein
LRKNTPKRVPTVARQVCHYECGFIAVCTSYNCGVLLKVLSLISLLNPHHFFVIWVKDPNGEKEIKVLGVGFGERPFFKRVLPNYAVYTPRQILIYVRSTIIKREHKKEVREPFSYL